MTNAKPTWAEIRRKIKAAYDKIKAAYDKIEAGIEKVKEHPVLDITARTALAAIPTAGPILLQWYDRAGESDEDKTSAILQILSDLQQQNEERFNRFSEDLKTNLDAIIENRIVLTDLISKRAEEILDRLARIEEQLKEIQDAVRPAGSPPVDIDALAAQATERTESLLAEAVDLQRQNKERQAIERLLTAYDMDMPPEAKAQLHTLAGNGYLRLGELKIAEDHYTQALEAARLANHRQREAAALGGLGLVYSDRGDLEAAEEHHREALSIAEEIEHKLGQSASLNNLGNVYLVRGDFEAAEEHHKRALALHQDIGNKLGQAASLGNLGIVYANRGELDKAEEYLKRSLGIQEEIGIILGQANQLGNLGNVHFLRGDLDRAEEYHKRALAIDVQTGNKLGQAQDLGNLGSVAAQRGDNGKARDLLQQAAALYDVIGAGGEGPETVREALQRLEAQSTVD